MTTSLPIIPHSRPSLNADDIRAVADVVRSGQLTQGPLVDEFERGLAAFVGVPGGVAVNSGTAALEVALLALGVGPGDEVILPSYVCAAPWLATVRVGAQARLVDIDPATYALDPATVAKAISARTKAIIAPHPFGLPTDLTHLESLGVPVVEDCAQTLGATERGRHVGTVGAVAICSFYATKLLCTGEGGMVLSRDTSILEKGKALRAYDEEPTVDSRSFNHKMTDLQAALGLRQLSRFRSFLDRRSAIAAAYQHAFAQTDLQLPVIPEGRTHVFYRYVVRVSRSRGGSRGLDDLLGRLERKGIQCRRPIFRPLHRYLDLDGFPETEKAMESALSVPIYPSLSEDEVTRICRTLGEELRTA